MFYGIWTKELISKLPSLVLVLVDPSFLLALLARLDLPIAGAP
jgi:hypothetical protein